MSTSDGTLNEAVSRLKGILSEPDEQPTDKPVNDDAEEQAANIKTEADTPTSDTEPKSRRVKAKLADRDVEFEVLTEGIDLDLIPKGLMMEADYRRKTMELAEQRKTFESEQTKFDDKIRDLEEALALDIEDLESPEMLELKADDDPEYWKKYDKADKRSKRLQKHRQDKQTKQQKWLDSEFQKLKDSTPDWLDESVMKKDFDLVADTLRTSGFKDDEMMNVFDSRLFPLIKKAALHDQMSKADLKDKRVKQAPKSTRPESMASHEEARTQLNDSMEKLKKTGKLRDAQAVIKQFL